MLVIILWNPIGWDNDPKWHWKKVLYAYLSPGKDEILYIGKAYKNTVRERWRYSGKEGFWDDLESQRGISKHIVLVGEMKFVEGVYLTDQLLSDIESLLIKRVKPWGNIQSKALRISRPGLRVRCLGGWNKWKEEYRDIG